MEPTAPARGGPRALLRNLREVMAAPGEPQEVLDRVVRLIASNMVAEVCSLYLLRAGDELELFATQGLNPKAVHRTRLKVGEGLVGDIAAHARPLNLKDAQDHPLFAYRPETGEEIYLAFLGVPILRSGRVSGVLAVQNEARRNYTEEEVEALQTIAMVLAEMVASGRLIDRLALTDAVPAGLPEQIPGRALAEGLAIGTARLHEPRIEVADGTIADDIPAEHARLNRAVEALRGSVENLLATPEMAPEMPHTREFRDIFEAYRMFAYDRGWLRRLQDAIDTGLTAEAAVKRVHDEIRARMNDIQDPYLRERLADFDDLANRLYRHLTGKGRVTAADLPNDSVLIARTMGPAELLDYDRKKLAGLVLEEGSTTSHAAIVARALNLPVIGRAKGVLDAVEPGDLVVVDADHEQVLVRPGAEALQAFEQSLAQRAERHAVYAALKHLPAETRDGVAIELHMNAGLLVDLHHLEDTGADGIGLYRTELHFMLRASMPKIAEQTSFYRNVLNQARDKPVVFRTLDVGGDKLLPFQTDEQEANPAMGWRAIRIALDRPALLRSQLRALLAAAAGRTLRVMFPMVAEVAEFRAARALLDIEVARLARLGRQLPLSIRVGTMLEVPALAWQLDDLLPEVDFVSVGSNDLMQFFFAADRGSPRVAERYDLLSPAVLSFLRHVVVRCDSAQVPVSLCGEMAGRPLEAMALLGIGFRTISMPSAAIGQVKEMVRLLDVGALSGRLEQLLVSGRRTLREDLSAFAESTGIRT